MERFFWLFCGGGIKHLHFLSVGACPNLHARYGQMHLVVMVERPVRKKAAVHASRTQHGNVSPCNYLRHNLFFLFGLCITAKLHTSVHTFGNTVTLGAGPPPTSPPGASELGLHASQMFK